MLFFLFKSGSRGKYANIEYWVRYLLLKISNQAWIRLDTPCGSKSNLHPLVTLIITHSMRMRCVHPNSELAEVNIVKYSRYAPYRSPIWKFSRFFNLFLAFFSRFLSSLCQNSLVCLWKPKYTSSFDLKHNISTVC